MITAHHRMPKFDSLVLKNQALALIFNIWSWGLSWLPDIFIRTRPRQPRYGEAAVEISGPGGLDRLRTIKLDDGGDGGGDFTCCVGYNVPGHSPSVTRVLGNVIPQDAVIVSNRAFSINYADVCIRWGLYESALRFVGWPIVPGFDIAGVVEVAGENSGFKAGQEVYGCTLFGGYGTRVLVPGRQLMLKPSNLGMEEAAAVPAVAGTALHALALAGFWQHRSANGKGPITPSLLRNRAVLIHSAAGGVGSMLVQMAKLLGCSPIVAVVGSTHKVEFCRTILGADVVIDKSQESLWSAARAALPKSLGGYAAIFDANGVSTLRESFDALDRCGRLIVYGFHSNLPRGADLLSPLAWIRMAYNMCRLPSFDPMELVLESKAVLGFNLSFFADEKELIKAYLEQVNEWIIAGDIRLGKVTVFDSMQNVKEAHHLIQSGSSIGKIVVRAQILEAKTTSTCCSSSIRTDTLKKKRV